ncbi:MAG TPA: PDZ domain-containing protein [Tepidisphaeraceae bacterium]|jgi:hypothetical protein
MKLAYLATALLAAAPIARGQDATPKPVPAPAQQRSASDDDAANQAEREKARAVRQADEAVRRAGQSRQSTNGNFGGKAVYPPIIAGQPQKGAWLGLTASPPPAALRRQLKVPDGTALVVDFVQPKSPADQAGIKQYDLLTKLNDQILINAEQLAVLVRTFKPNEEIRLTYFREGERRTQGVTLVERDLPPLDEMQLQFFNNNTNLRFAPTRVAPFGDAQNAPGAATKDTTGASPQANAHSITWFDGRREIAVSLSDDRKTMTVTDNRIGKVMYQGPIDSVVEQTSLSRESRDAVERIRTFIKSNSNTAGDDSAKPPAGF